VVFVCISCHAFLVERSPGPERMHLAGRDEPLARIMAGVLSTLSEDARSAGRGEADVATAFLVSGDPGAGKSALVAAAAERASAAGVRVLSAAGRARESMSSFDGLHRLLEPLLPYALTLPGRLGLTTQAVIKGGTSTSPRGAAPLDPALVRNGVLSVLSDAATDVPMAVCVDDFDQLDAGSRDVLLAVVGRLADAAEERIAFVFAQRGDTVTEEIAVHCALLDLGPLDAAQSTALLDSLPVPPTGHARLKVLHYANGNPLALIELSRLAAADLNRAGLTGDALPITDRLLAVFGEDIETMPAPTRWALLLAAAGEYRLWLLEADPVGVDPAWWEPAEAAGLITTNAGTVRFRHPLIQSAVLQSAGEPERRRAHELLAAGLTGDPGRRAWHLSVSCLMPDETVAAELSIYADAVQRQGDAAGAAALLQRAAEVGAPGPDRVGRLIRAAGLAGSAGHAGWVQELASEVERATDEAIPHAVVTALAGWSLVMADRPAAALDRLLPAAHRLVDNHIGAAVGLVFTSALPAYMIGDDRTLDRFRKARDTVVNAADGGGTSSSPYLEMPFIAAVAAPDEELLDRLAAFPEPPVAVAEPDQFLAAATIGAAAYVLDESRLAIRHLSPLVDAQRRGMAFSPTLASFIALGWALLDAGRWQAATDNARQLQRINTVPRLALLEAAASAQLAIIDGLRGPRSATAMELRRAEAAFTPSDNPVHAAHLAILRSRLAAADDDFATAFEQLTALFHDDGRPRHRHLASLALGDLASAARRTGRTDHARMLAAPLLNEERWRSARQLLVTTRAAVLLGTNTGQQLERLAECAQDPAGEQWPLERALTYLDVADVARSQRQPDAARDALLAATDIFEQLGARRFEDRVHRELRATGVRVEPTAADPVAGLTDQQRQIVKMAAEGLTNREIGQAMFLSPRTVGSHLYRVFPKLGITSRAQLPAAMFPAGESAAP